MRAEWGGLWGVFGAAHARRPRQPALTSRHPSCSCPPLYRCQVADVYRKVRFTLRYLLGNLADFDPAAHAVPHAGLAAADRYILARFAALVAECGAAYDNYQFYKYVGVGVWGVWRRG